MPRNNFPMHNVPRVELDHRAREARLRFERAERLFVPRPAVKYAWLRRLTFILIARVYAGTPQKRRMRKPLSNRRPSIPRSIRPYCPTEAEGCCSVG
jgi:hypothetical protein